MKLHPESLFRVTAGAEGLSVVYLSGQERSVSWNALERVVVRTNDLGPFLPDVFWEIQPAGAPAFLFPGGATGEDAFLAAAQVHLAGFRNDQLIEAMTSTSNREFVVWERDR